MIDTPFINWFDRTVGDWTSERRYLFNMKKKTPVNLTTDFSITHGGARESYVVDWTGKTSGTMVLTVERGYLKRSRDYFGEGNHDSKLSLIDHDAILLQTSYGGNTYREEIRLLDNDNIRLRQTIGFSDETGEPTLVGQYAEFRTTPKQF